MKMKFSFRTKYWPRHGERVWIQDSNEWGTVTGCARIGGKVSNVQVVTDAGYLASYSPDNLAQYPVPYPTRRPYLVCSNGERV